MANKIIEIDTLVVGAGQAGVAISEHLTAHGVPHIVLERDRIAERWRSARWDSLVANGPAWHDRFPGMEFAEFGDHEFVPKDKIAEYFEQYAKRFDAPIETGVNVTKVSRHEGKPGFRVTTSTHHYDARSVVAATGPFQLPSLPPIAPSNPAVFQIHSSQYRNPEQLPEGAVLVVGAGSSGTQIADELQQQGRKVFLSVGAHDRPPRSYRGRDFVWWLGVLGKWDIQTVKPGTEHTTIAVTGSRGIKGTVDFRALAHQGVTLVGLTDSFEHDTVTFRDDLVTNIQRGDHDYLALLDAADDYIEKNGLDFPLEPEAREIPHDPHCLTHPIRSLSLEQEKISTVIWATGYTQDYSWLDVDAFDEQGRPAHQRGISKHPGIYFIGLPWLSSRGSSFIWGVWHDARFIADHIATQRKYLTQGDLSKRQC
ncbi:MULTISPECIES: flavin-containing monooxygenase [Grimontia]|uniref:Putative oxidoreductase CzcO n=1 Tax=Grimontia marina TaxID=646534 RepID=A0A128FH05_9GAMM|nr:MULTISPECIES: NAD(P)/FAD-dependent oxidoreductase [Grimontia]WRW00848.1 NAD(P)/FAD-dependent oxidoreductase [Grimontia sp. NTOU-MAR1]CZF85840.1 putative oxidoreductase CzcO [Grimontia marina]